MHAHFSASLRVIISKGISLGTYLCHPGEELMCQVEITLIAYFKMLFLFLCSSRGTSTSWLEYGVFIRYFSPYIIVKSAFQLGNGCTWLSILLSCWHHSSHRFRESIACLWCNRMREKKVISLLVLWKVPALSIYKGLPIACGLKDLVSGPIFWFRWAELTCARRQFKEQDLETACVFLPFLFPPSWFLDEAGTVSVS